MADVDLQALLDPDATGRGIRIIKRVDAGASSSYYCVGNVTGKGQCLWTNVTTADSDATKDTAIRGNFGVA